MNGVYVGTRQAVKFMQNNKAKLIDVIGHWCLFELGE